MSKNIQLEFSSAVCRFWPAAPLSFAGTEKSLQASFERAGMGEINASRYLSGSLVLSAAAAILVFLLLTLFLPLPESLGISLLLFSAKLSAFLLLPKILAKRREEKIESELPFLLRELSVYLDIGLPFEKALARLSGRNYELSPELSLAHQAIKSGSTVQRELSMLSARTGSLALKRCLLLLSSIYETGAASEPLKRTAEELSATQLSQMRLQSSRLSLLAIVFIAAGALVPAFFSVFAAASPLLSQSQVPDWQVWLAFALVFPLLQLGVLAAMSLLLPPAPSFRATRALLEEELLRKAGFPFGINAFLSAAAALSFLAALLLFAAGSPLLAALCLCAAPGAYFLLSYFSRREIEQAELRLPDALYSAAATHRLLSAEKMLSSLAKGEFGRLSESFELALHRQKAGEGFAASMAAASQHCPSALVERAFSLLVVCYETGADMYFALREAASDVVSFFALVRERAALVAVQRYTVLAASCLLVPLILGTALSFAPALFSASSPLLAGARVLPTLFLACQLYLAISAALSSFFLALLETNLGKVALYFLLSAPLSQIVFALASSGALLA